MFLRRQYVVCNKLLRNPQTHKIAPLLRINTYRLYRHSTIQHLNERRSHIIFNIQVIIAQDRPTSSIDFDVSLARNAIFWINGKLRRWTVLISLFALVFDETPKIDIKGKILFFLCEVTVAR